jgi:DNA-binding GntR family transcriptional regulator
MARRDPGSAMKSGTPVTLTPAGSGRGSRRELFRESVANYLRGAIASGALQPGERIVERTVAEELGVSRVPVREAVKVLEREGLVSTRPHAGATVAEIPAEEIEEIVAVRRLVEKLAIRDAVEQSTERDIARLRALVLEIGRAARAGEEEQLMHLDLSFHYGICRASGHRTLSDLMECILPRLTVIFYRQIMLSVTPDEMGQAHAQLVDAIEARDRDKAVEAVDRHIDHFYSDILQRGIIGRRNADPTRTP